MNMLSPGFLLLLGLIPLLVFFYLWILRRRRRYAVRFSSLSLLREAMPQSSPLRRHLPFVLFLAALSSLTVALGRPTATVMTPYGQSTVILAVDVSRSMCSVDIPPNRLEAAKTAADSFIRSQKSGTQMGIVTFAGFAVLAQTPTNDKEVLTSVIDSLETARRTAIGSAILESIDAIAAIDPNIPPSSNRLTTESQSLPTTGGTLQTDIIVLLTDGASNTGPLPIDAAIQAAARGIRIYTIGFGTENGGNMDCSGSLFGGSGPNPFSNEFGGGYYRLSIDEPTLKDIARRTGGEYFAATSSNELNKVFKELTSRLSLKPEQMEISVAFAAAGAVLILLAVMLSLVWHPLP